jgi:hypothetical protein
MRGEGVGLVCCLFLSLQARNTRDERCCGGGITDEEGILHGTTIRLILSSRR